jgi:hypothetical protein
MMIDWLPKAERDPKGRVLSWTEKTDPKGCLHTTETSGRPGYKNWTVHPHATIRPIPNKGIEIRQNIPFSRASFSLRNLPGGVQTNTDYVFQFELIGTSERGGPGYFWPDADGTVLLALYDDLIKPLSDAAGIPLRAQPFQSYPASYGARGQTNTVRLSGGSFDDYSGWLGHQHVPENVHGDPGAFPWARMMKLVEEREKGLNVDERTLRRIIREEIVDVLKTEPIVENMPTKAALAVDPKAKPTLFTLSNALRNIETDQDNDRDSGSRAQQEQRDMLKAVADSQTRILQLLGKLAPADPA